LQCTISRHAAISADEETITSAMTAFVIAVGASALVCYALMTRLEPRARSPLARRRLRAAYR
jgi:hypothetical protein